MHIYYSWNIDADRRFDLQQGFYGYFKFCNALIVIVIITAPSSPLGICSFSSHLFGCGRYATISPRSSTRDRNCTTPDVSWLKCLVRMRWELEVRIAISVLFTPLYLPLEKRWGRRLRDVVFPNECPVFWLSFFYVLKNVWAESNAIVIMCQQEFGHLYCASAIE